MQQYRRDVWVGVQQQVREAVIDRGVLGLDLMQPTSSEKLTKHGIIETLLFTLSAIMQICKEY